MGVPPGSTADSKTLASGRDALRCRLGQDAGKRVVERLQDEVPSGGTESNRSGAADLQGDLCSHLCALFPKLLNEKSEGDHSNSQFQRSPS